MKRQTETALVIAGGGAKGAFAVGAIRRLYERFRDDGWFTIVGGSSTGALIAPFAALLGADAPLRDEVMSELGTVYSTVRTQDILERHGPMESLLRRESLNETDPLRGLIERNLTPEYFDLLQDPETPTAFVVYTNFNTGESVRVSPKDPGVDRERFITAMLASASVPVIMEPAVIDGDICYDGGARDVLPMNQAVDMGAHVIVPIFLDPRRLPPATKPLSRMDRVLFRAVAIMLDEILLNDYEMAAMVQRGVKLRQTLRKEFRWRPGIRRRIEKILADPELEPLIGESKRLIRIVPGIRPSAPITDDGLKFDPAQMRLWMEQGALAAEIAVKESPFTVV